MNKMETEKIYNNYLRYTNIPAVTGNVDEIAGQLCIDFNTNIYFRGCPQRITSNSNLLFVVHMDRVPVKDFDPLMENNIIKGQLDNAISLAVMKTLFDEGLDFNIMFTKDEEYCICHKDVINFCDFEDRIHNREFVVVDCDIDVFSEEEMWKNCISIRGKDNIGDFDLNVVKKVRALAKKENLQWIAKTGDWGVCTAGFISYHSVYPAFLIGLPILNYHSENEIVDIRSLKTYYDMLKVLCKENWE
jgi:putative aminopeptidase FrvX